MSYEIKKDGKYSYIEEGNGEVIMLLHGLFGALSNFKDLIEHFRKNYKVVVPMLPLLEIYIFILSVFNKFLHKFLKPTYSSMK